CGHGRVCVCVCVDMCVGHKDVCDRPLLVKMCKYMTCSCCVSVNECVCVRVCECGPGGGVCGGECVRVCVCVCVYWCCVCVCVCMCVCECLSVSITCYSAKVFPPYKRETA